MKPGQERQMLPPRKVRILESKYIEKSDLIKWKLHFYDDGIEQIYVWPSIDLLKSLGIQGKATKEHLVKFCNDMLNKDIFFVIDKEPKLTIPTERDIDPEDALNISEEISKRLLGE